MGSQLNLDGQKYSSVLVEGFVVSGCAAEGTFDLDGALKEGKGMSVSLQRDLEHARHCSSGIYFTLSVHSIFSSIRFHPDHP